MWARPLGVALRRGVEVWTPHARHALPSGEVVRIETQGTRNEARTELSTDRRGRASLQGNARRRRER